MGSSSRFLSLVSLAAGLFGCSESKSTNKNECTPVCDGMECGDDGCGGSCGTCGAPETCGGTGTAGVCGTPTHSCGISGE
jgi:hypothetical protein